MKPRYILVSAKFHQRGMGDTYGKHLVGFIQNEHLHVVGLENTACDHILNTARGTDNDLWAILKSLHVLANICATNAGMALNAHEVTNGDNDFLNLLSQFTGWGKNESLAGFEVGVDLLQTRDRESGGLSSAGLCLCNDIRS